MPVLTAFENVELPLLLTSLSRRERRERVALALVAGRAVRPRRSLARTSSPAASSSASPSRGR